MFHVHFGVLLAFMPLFAMAAPGDQAATPSTPPEITIVRKTGQEDGIAQMKVKNKIHKITPHAVQALTVRGGEGALILVLNKKAPAPKRYELRYYDLDSGRRRILGTVPFSSVTIQEYHPAYEGWAFALSGKDLATSQPVTIVGGDQAIPGVIPGAISPSFTEDSLTWTTAPGGEKHSAKITDLLGTSLNGIYSPPQSSIADLQYLQLFPNASAMIVSKDNTIHQGSWQTDGHTISLTAGTASLTILQASLQPIQGVPAGTRFSVRLLDPLSSRIDHEGMTIHAVSISPIVVGDSILIPQGSAIQGTIVQANNVGWGFKHETASLTIAWNQATLPDGRVVPITARVFEVENAQEKTKDNGKIQGIRSTATPGHTVENAVLTFAGIDPIAYIFASASGSAVLGFAEPEILYKAGTELLLEYTHPIITSQVYQPAVPPSAANSGQREQLQAFVHTLPFLTRTKGSNKPSDLTNLVFVGSPEALQRAFTAAGWVPTDDLTSASTFRTLKTLSGNQTYTQAPMSVLLLDERAPIFTLSKTTNTFFSRHHIRVFPTQTRLDGRTVLTASSTEDTGIAFSRKQKTFIHVIDQHIDNERSKVVNDLIFTGCVDDIDMVPRPWLPTDAFNSTGDRLLTDREAAVLHINDCDHPRATPDTPALAPNRFQRITRNTALSLRNDLYRGNLIYQGIAGSIAARNYFKTSNDLPQDYGAWRKTDSSGASYNLIDSSNAYTRQPILRRRANDAPDRFETSPEDQAAIAAAKASHKWDPPRYEFAIEGGYLHFREEYLSYIDLLSTSEQNPLIFELDLYDQVNDGWAAGGTVTVNSWRHFSNEFSYFRQQGKYTLSLGVALFGTPVDDDNEDSQFASTRVGIVTRQFEYNLLYHFRKPESRWRPYIAAGPTFQLIALSDAPLKKPAGYYTVGLKNIGLIKAAFDFGNTRPLDGGGIFQFGVQYGAGIKYRVTPHIMTRADFRETWSQNPNIIQDSYKDFEFDFGNDVYTTETTVYKPEQKFFQDRFTLGVAFTF